MKKLRWEITGGLEPYWFTTDHEHIAVAVPLAIGVHTLGVRSIDHPRRYDEWHAPYLPQQVDAELERRFNMSNKQFWKHIFSPEWLHHYCEALESVQIGMPEEASARMDGRRKQPARSDNIAHAAKRLRTEIIHRYIQKINPTSITKKQPTRH